MTIATLQIYSNLLATRLNINLVVFPHTTYKEFSQHT